MNKKNNTIYIRMLNIINNVEIETYNIYYNLEDNKQEIEQVINNILVNIETFFKEYGLLDTNKQHILEYRLLHNIFNFIFILEQMKYKFKPTLKQTLTNIIKQLNKF